MGDPVRLAHIGVAYPHGDGYIETLLLMPGIELVALYDPDPAAARSLLPPEFQGLGVYDDFDEVLRKERPEAVLITQPNDTTARFITQAAEAGVHVFAEKPCARTAAELMPAIEAVRASGGEVLHRVHAARLAGGHRHQGDRREGRPRQPGVDRGELGDDERAVARAG